MTVESDRDQRDNRRKFAAFQPYPRNAWYVAAGRSEVGEALLARRIADQPVVLFRDPDGEVHALRDACPHRGFPLSRSRLDGGRIHCGYHGMVFDSEGACTAIPSNPGLTPTEAMRVRRYPVVEKWHWVWVWTGDPERADPALLPDFECERWAHYDHRFYAPLGPFHGALQLLHDNLCDTTHTSYLHAGLLDDPEATEMALAQPEVTRLDERSFRVRRSMSDFVPNEAVAKLYHLEPGARYNRSLEVWHHLPGSLVAFNRYHLAGARQGEDLGPVAAEHVTALGLTPATHNTSYHFTAATTSFPQTEVDREALLFVIQQDLEAFGAIQTYFEESGDEAVEVSAPSDRLGLMSRKIMADLVRAESA